VAAALLPLLTPLLPTITNDIIGLITGLVHKSAPVAEANNGPATGPVKFAEVFVSAMSDLVKAHAANQIVMLPDEATVKLVIQSVVSSLKLSGQLSGAGVGVPAATPQSVVLTAGQSIVVSVN
jgi:hypothetical protein